MTYDKGKVNSEGWIFFLFPNPAAVLFTQVLGGKSIFLMERAAFIIE